MGDQDVRVAVFTDTYDEVNGVANTFRYLTEFCERTGRYLDVYCHAVDDADSIEERGTVRILRYKSSVPLDIYFDMIFDLKFPRVRVMKEFHAGAYDVVHTATPGSMGLNALAGAKREKLPLVGSYHTTLPEYVRVRVEKIVSKFRLPTDHTGERSEDLTWKFMQWYYNHCRVVLAPSSYTQGQLEKKLEVPVRIFSRGIETERFHPKYREEQAGVQVLYVGRVSAEKNLHVLAEVFEGREDAELVIVGDGPYREEMQARCPRARFMGFLKGEALQKAYASAEVFVFPSTSDTFGNVVLEAMSSGLPVVVTDQMGPKELVEDGENGFVARVEGEFAEKVDLLIRDGALRERMGAAAREYALSRSWDVVFEKLFGEYAAVRG